MPTETRIEVAEAVPCGVRLTVAAAVLAMAFLVPRAYIVHRAQFTEWPTGNILLDLAKLAIAGSPDTAFTAGLVAAFLALLTLARRSARRAQAVYMLFLISATLCVAIAVANIRVTGLLGRPFNYRWLYYSDFLHSVDASEALRNSLEWNIAAVILVAAAGYLLVSVRLGEWIDHEVLALRRQKWAFIGAVMVTLLLWSVVGQLQVAAHGWDAAKLANPVYEFAHSWLTASSRPALFTMQATEFGHEFSPSVRSVGSLAPAHPAIRNVILFVLESTPSEYLGVYGSTLGVTPTIDQLAAHSAVFENIYAHAPATNKSLFSILCSTYPWVSYKSESEEKPDIPLPSLVSELRKHGYVTGFFSSGDLSFQSARKFLNARGFDYLEDYTQRDTSRTIFRSGRWPFLNGSDDVSTAESMVRWIHRQHSAGRPIFGMLWTNMTHYPYFTNPTLHRFGSDENSLNRYLNALHTGDEALGTLVRSLQEAGIADETLVVVTGDHGEAFGRHNQVSHAGRIYEENCHVPLLFINSRLFRGERNASVGGLVDLAPTIMGILGQASPAEWQGQSLFASNRPDRTFFFSPWSDYLFGYREGALKFLYNATQDEYEIYDLSRDPQEQANLAAQHPREARQRVSRLAGWIQYQDRLFRRLIPMH